jgi:hypothetical protein
MRPPFFHDPRRAAKATVLVPLTPEEAELAVEALRHVGREIFEDSPKGERLQDASTAVAQALAGRR